MAAFDMTIADPRSLEDIETLVKQLYLPGSPKLISRVQGKLHHWQKSDAGWEVAERLLSSDDANVRFFGALTLTVKINVDWKKLDTDDGPTTDAVLSGIISYLIRYINPPGRNEPFFVIKKLCSTLVTLFTKTSRDWSQAIRQLVLSFVHGSFIDSASLGAAIVAPQVITQLGPLQLQAVIWFATDLADEVIKLESIEHQRTHECMQHNLDDVKWLIHHALRAGDSSDLFLDNELNLAYRRSLSDIEVRSRQAGLSCFVAWSGYGQRQWMASSTNLETVIGLIPDALMSLYLDVDDSEDILVDWIEQCAPVLRSRSAASVRTNFYQLLQSLWSASQARQLQNADPSGLPFVRFVIAFSEIEIQNLYEDSTSSKSRTLLDLLHSFLACPGVAADDDEVIILAMEFWSSYIENINEEVYQHEGQNPPWFSTAVQEAGQALQEFFNKMRFPPAHVVSHWGTDTRRAFSSFRNDFQDMLQSAYSFLGRELTHSLTHTIRSQLISKDWQSLEASMFCLNALADPISENLTDSGPDDEMLTALFGSSLFADLAVDQSIPARTRRTAVDMLGQFSVVFERRVELLPGALNFLFSSLPAANLAFDTSRSISALCASCRSHLTGQLPVFIQQYATFCTLPTADVYTKEKVLGGIAAVVQAVTPIDQQIIYVARLLDFVEEEVRQMLQHVAATQIEEGQVRAQTAMSCLASMGRGLQAPDDAHIGVTIDERSSQPWHPAQERVMRTINATTQVLDRDGELMEQTCHVLRAGYKEKLPGPFVLPARATIEYMTRTHLQTPRLPYILSTACIFVKSHIDRSSASFAGDAFPLALHVLGLLKQLEQPAIDPEVAQGCIELLAAFLSGELATMITGSQFDARFAFNFTLAALLGPDVLPKRAAASFWTSVITVSAEGIPTAQAVAKEALSHFGPTLCDILMNEISGNAPQSALEYLSTPLIKLVGVQPTSRRLLEQSLNRILSGAGGAVEAAKNKFLKMILSARGAAARNLMSDLWLASRQHALSMTSTGTATDPQIID